MEGISHTVSTGLFQSGDTCESYSGGKTSVDKNITPDDNILAWHLYVEDESRIGGRSRRKRLVSRLGGTRLNGVINIISHIPDDTVANENGFKRRHLYTYYQQKKSGKKIANYKILKRRVP